MPDPSAQSPGPPFAEATILTGPGRFVLKAPSGAGPDELLDAGDGETDVLIEEV